MDVDMVNLLAQAVVDSQLVVIGDSQFLRHSLGRIEQQMQHLGGCLVEIGVFLFGND